MELMASGVGGLREQAVALLNDAKTQGDTSVKTDMLKRLKEIVLHRDPSLLHEFLPHLMELQTERAGPVRNLLFQVIEEIGSKHLEHIPLMVPVLLNLMQDETHAVARHAVSTGSNLFRVTFEQVALQGIYSGRIEKRLEESWVWVNNLKAAIYAAAQEHKSVRLLAIKFVETVILLFTPDPSGPSQPPPLQHNLDGRPFNVAWLAGGHPLLDLGVLGQEAIKNLAMLLDQLRAPEISNLPGPVAIVLVNSLASIAKRRPSLYGRVLPVLLGLGPNCEAIKGAQVASVAHALKNAFLSLLKCTHSGAGPWREHLMSALRAMNAGDVADAAVRQMDRNLRNAEKERAFRDSRTSKDERLERKRPPQENGVLSGVMDETLAKRVRAAPMAVLAGSQEATGSQAHELFGLTPESNLTPLQHMIALIGALVAKGERAASSIDILIASLPADMLADVVIENMRNLPATPPPITSGLSTAGTTGLISIPTTGSLGLSSTSELLEPTQTIADHRRDPRRDPRRMDPRRTAAPVGVLQPACDVQPGVKIEDSLADLPNNVPISSSNTEQISFIPGISDLVAKPEAATQSKDSLTFVPPAAISEPALTPGLSISLSTVTIPMPGLLRTEEESHSVEAPLTSAMDLAESVPLMTSATEASTVGAKKEFQAAGGGALTTSAAAIQGLTVVHLDAEQQSAVWKSILLRILESYRLVGSAGGAELRLSLLARLIAQADRDNEALTILQKHILADYQNHKGHELAIHTLYQLYAEKLSHEAAIDNTTTTSTVYEDFLIAVAHGLRDTLPPSDRSLSKLLGEAPILPKVALDFLESLCSPASSTAEGNRDGVVERITQGLTAVWSLILLRPPIRAECLDIALKCAVHELDEVRTKAIRLVANKLFPLPYVSQMIEDFATKMLLSVVQKSQNQASLSSHDVHMEQVVEGLDTNAASSGGADEDQHKGGRSPVSVQEAQRCMSLYFALCTKKHLLLQHIFSIYEDAPKAAKQAIHRHTPVLIRTIGSSSAELMRMISDPPAGSTSLLLLVLHILTESSPPSLELIAAIKTLYEQKIKDARLLTPILSSLSKEEVLPIFPQLVALPSEDFKAALDRILQGSVQSGPALTPAEVLIAIHGIDPDRDHIPLSKVKDACAVCFQQRTVFTQQVLAKVLNQLVEQTPLPMLFMRTVILAVGSFRSLVSFVMEILSRLVSKQIWKWPNLWIGFLKCADQTQPHSFHVLLQLPAVQLEKALNKNPNLRAPLTAHAGKPNVRSTLPRSSLVVLGLAQDVSSSEPASIVQSHAAAADVTSATSIAPDTQVTEPATTTS